MSLFILIGISRELYLQAVAGDEEIEWFCQMCGVPQDRSLPGIPHAESSRLSLAGRVFSPQTTIRVSVAESSAAEPSFMSYAEEWDDGSDFVYRNRQASFIILLLHYIIQFLILYRFRRLTVSAMTCTSI